MMNEEQAAPSLTSRFMQPGEEQMVHLVSIALHDIGMHPVPHQVADLIAAALRCGREQCNEPVGAE
jgi:hypothetical protein